METARMVYEKLGRKVKKGELERILRWLEEDESPEMICERFIVPSQPEGSLPEGNYAKDTHKNNYNSRYQLQDASAKLLASKGYKVEMLDEIQGGNGYGIDPKANPDFLIEGRVFDCYAPEEGTKMKNMSTAIAEKTDSQAVNIILNLTDYKGDVSELISYLKRRTSPKGDLKRLEELWIIKDGKIIKVFDE